MQCVYEFELVRSGDWYVVYPFGFGGGATQGADLAEASVMAADWLKTMLSHYLMSGEPFPEPTLGHEPERGGRILVVSVEVSLDTVPTVSATEAAEMLGVGKSRVSQMVKDGLLAGYKDGRDVRVTIDSIETRKKHKPKAGRPKKLSADSSETQEREGEPNGRGTERGSRFDEADYSTSRFLMLLKGLREVTPVHASYEGALGQKEGHGFKTEKQHMLSWFSSQATTGGGQYTRVEPNSSARRTYQRLQNASSLIWLAEALGEDPETVQQAANAAIAAGDRRRACKVVREIVPWARICELIESKSYHW